MKEIELVLIPLPAMGHIVAMVETAKLLVERDNRISVTVLVIKPAIDPSTTKYTESLTTLALPNRMRVIGLPALESNTLQDRSRWITHLIQGQKPHVREVVSKLLAESELNTYSPRLGGFVFDTFCTGMKDVANEFGVPWYVFSASGAAFLGSMLHVQVLHDEQNVDLADFRNSDAMLEIPSLVNSFPARLLPSMVLEDESRRSIFLDHARWLRESKGILVNTFTELESHAVSFFANDGMTPPLYPVGPILKRRSDQNNTSQFKDIMEWLDDQPPSSVVFLCFGSWGSFGADQVKEIAYALEHSEHRFLWTLRKPSPSTGKMEPPSDFIDFQEILPEGFLDRTAKIGKVIGWAPQVDILAHPSVGGFLSHCGWNSTLESIFYGIPIATWPIYGEQQFNAFQIVIELGIGVEVKMDYRRNDEEIVSSHDIEKGIRCVMTQDNEIRKKMKEMSEISKKCLMASGSSYSSLTHLIDDMINMKYHEMN